MKKIVIVLVGITILFIGEAFVENYFNNPVRGCRQFSASESYVGYHCKDATYYQPN